MLKNNFMLLLKSIILCFVCGLRAAQSLENIAYNKPADQSSTYFSVYHYGANKAVDGNKNTFALGGQEPSTLNWWKVDLMSEYYISQVIPTPRQDFVYEYGAYKAVDGDKTTYALGDQEPRTLNWWKVDLMSEYYISQVILTPRQDFDAGRMNNVFIGISNSPDISGDIKYPVYPLCRQSPYKVYKSSSIYQDMSISCRPNTPSGRYVFVQQPDVSPGYLTICEIQVYGIKLENIYLGNNTCQGNYYGDNCDKYCNCDKGVKCDQQGICPNGCDVNWEGEHCNKRTYNNNQLLGCFEISDSSNHQFSRLNSQSCIITCSGYGFTFAANMTSEVLCICTDILNWTKLCQKNCSPQNCQNFYSVCPNGTFGYDCTLKCNCLNNGRCSYMEGRCEDGCANGWTGDSCDIRNCMSGNGGCDQNEICVSNSSDVTSCQCKEGYIRTSVWSSCLSESTRPINEVNKSAVIGGVIGSIAGSCLIIALIILFVKFRKRMKISNLIASMFVVKPCYPNSNELSNNEPNRTTFKLQGIQIFVEDNAPNYVDEFQKINLNGSPHLKYSKYEKNINHLNRFKNIIPYDHNRVKLMREPNSNQSGYINASYIKGIVKDVLIAAQGPVKNSICDFWKMIWQQNIGIVIMLCNYVERKKVKCEQYLPEASSLNAGEYKIQHHKTISWPFCKMTELLISNNVQQRSVVHLHFTEWPDHGVPNNVFYLLDFCRRCQKLYERGKCGILVHCSAGVGRTGSFLAIYDLLAKGYKGFDLSVPETVNNLRRQRMKMVEKQAQYNFIYEALIEEVKLGPTSFSENEFTKYYQNLKDGSIERSHMLNQHQTLSNFYSNNENKDEISRFIKIVTSAYNFCLMTCDTSLITWQNIPETQCIIMFGPVTKNNIVPKIDHPIINGQICISLVNETNTEWGKVSEIQKKGDNESSYENVVVDAYQNITMSREKSLKIFVVDKKEDYLDFPTFMELFSQLPTDENVTLILGNNHKLGYFFVAACNIISQLKVYDEVAILQNLCELCKVTDHQPSQISFEKLHQIVHEFILTSG